MLLNAAVANLRVWRENVGSFTCNFTLIK